MFAQNWLLTARPRLALSSVNILRLSKLNYNSCKFADGYPITLKFASKVGDILTTLPPGEGEAEGDDADEYTPLPFWHYI